MLHRLSRNTIFIVVAILVAALAVLYGIERGHVHAGLPASLAPFALTNPAKAAPLVGFEDENGKHHTLAEFRGHYVLLNLWASWCAPCVKELPALAKLSEAVPQSQLTVIAVDVGRGGASEARTFLKDHGAAILRPYVDKDLALMRGFGSLALPLTVLIDPHGKVIGRAMGAVDWDAPDSIAYFKTLKP